MPYKATAALGTRGVIFGLGCQVFCGPHGAPDPREDPKSRTPILDSSGVDDNKPSSGSTTSWDIHICTYTDPGPSHVYRNPKLDLLCGSAQGSGSGLGQSSPSNSI